MIKIRCNLSQSFYICGLGLGLAYPTSRIKPNSFSISTVKCAGFFKDRTSIIKQKCMQNPK